MNKFYIKKTDIVSLILWIMIFEIIGYFIGISTKSGMYTYYQNLIKSNLTPQDYVFSLVWPVLYCLLAICGYLLYANRNSDDKKWLFFLFSIQMILNWLWSPVFFNLQFANLALSILLLIVVINTYLIIKFMVQKNARLYVILILPYFFWVCFASYLNIFIVLNNYSK